MRRALITGLAFSASVALAACGGAASPTAAPPSPAASVAAPSTAAGDASSPAASQPAAATSAVTIQNFAFAPATLTVKAGVTVTWSNQDAPAHSVKWDDGSTGSPHLATGATYSRTFATPGTYTYVCGIHSSMKGVIIVN